jgi:phosphatidylinositol alpha-1,6-mannosyltransferase
VRVLAISSYGVLGGAELSMSTFLEHRPADCEAEVLLVRDGPVRQHLTDLGLAVEVAVGCEGRPKPGHFRRFSQALRPMLARYRPDVVWAVGQKAALLSVAVCRRRRVPMVWHKVDFAWDRELAKPLAIGARGVIGVSRAVVGALGPLRRSRLLGVVGPPLNLPDGLQAHPDPARPTIGTLARLVPYKGHHQIIEAAALLSDRFPGLRVVLAGAPVLEYPDYPESLGALAARLGISDRVEMTGFVSNVIPVLEGLTVYVNATHVDEEGYGLEGLSGAMLEASWAGVPVVATRGGGTEEGVVDGVTGTVVDDPEPAVLASAMAPYLEDAALASRTGAAGRDFARQHFRADVGARRVFELLSRVA